MGENRSQSPVERPKFTFSGGLSVCLRAAPGAIELVVRDSGVGIPEHAVGRIFERFHRVTDTRARTHEGTGIGLSLVQELVKMHGGRIAVASELGRGTTFTVGIPAGCAHLPAERIGVARTLVPTAIGAAAFIEEVSRSLPNDSPVERLETLDVDPRRSVHGDISSERRARILLVDDNADMRQYVRRLLASGYDVDEAADGFAALHAVATRMPDLVLADVMMPRLDGFELLRRLRTTPETSRLPVILVSARAGEESRLEALQAGAYDYLVKPFSARELLARVAARLEMARLLEEEAREALRCRLVDAQEDERRRIALDMHDEFGQQLSALAMKLSALKRDCERRTNLRAELAALETITRQLDMDLELIVSRLRPPELGELGLTTAFAQYVKRWSDTTGVRAEWHATGVPPRHLTGETEVALYRIAQEALNNVAKHAHASNVSVLLDVRSDRASLIIEDDGAGFDPECPTGLRRQVGLNGMRERAALAGGTLDFESFPGKGTTVVARIPFPASPQGGEM